LAWTGLGDLLGWAGSRLDKFDRVGHGVGDRCGVGPAANIGAVAHEGADLVEALPLRGKLAAGGVVVVQAGPAVRSEIPTPADRGLHCARLRRARSGPG